MNKLKRALTDLTILKRILVTIGFILLFRFGTLVAVPGATVTTNTYLSGSDGSFLGLMNLLGGGGLSTFSIFALGVTPYITATIIIQLLSADVIPPLARLNKQGEKGRIKIEKITRILVIFLAIIQGLAISLALLQTGYISTANGFQQLWANLLFYTLILLAGSMIAIWIADQITMKGIGNGTSLLIFSGVVAALPKKMISSYNFFVPPSASPAAFAGIMNFMIYLSLFFVLVIVVSFMQVSERRIPIQQTGSGLQLEKKKAQYLPIKVNPAGVVPVIFASAIITLFPTIAQFLPQSAAKNWILVHFALTNWFGLTLYGLLVFGFTFFYSHININSSQTSENFQKSGTFIVGVKPGEETRKYISKTTSTLALFGALILTTIAVLPFIFTFFGIPQYIAIGGTGTIIMVSVGINTWDQLNARIIASETKTYDKRTSKKTKIKGFGTQKSVEVVREEKGLFD